MDWINPERPLHGNLGGSMTGCSWQSSELRQGPLVCSTTVSNGSRPCENVSALFTGGNGRRVNRQEPRASGMPSSWAWNERRSGGKNPRRPTEKSVFTHPRSATAKSLIPIVDADLNVCKSGSAIGRSRPGPDGRPWLLPPSSPGDCKPEGSAIIAGTGWVSKPRALSTSSKDAPGCLFRPAGMPLSAARSTSIDHMLI